MFLYKDNYELLFIDYIPFKSCSWKLNKSFFLNEFLFEYYLSLGLSSNWSSKRSGFCLPEYVLVYNYSSVW